MPALDAHARLARPRRVDPGPAPCDPSRGRRRRALLKLAERHGEVRVTVRDARGAVAHAADVLDLLDELNAAERLCWGGLHKQAGVAQIVYLKS